MTIQWKAEAAAVPNVAKGDLISFQISRSKYRVGRVIGNTKKVLTLDSGGEHFEIDPEDFDEIAQKVTISYMKPNHLASAMKEEYTLAKLRKLVNPDGDVRPSSGPRKANVDKEPATASIAPAQVYDALKAYKGVIAEKITQMPDGALHVTLAHAATSMASAMFTLRTTGTKVRVVNAEVSAIPAGDPVGSGRWTKVRTPDEGTLANVLRPVVTALQKKAQQKVKSSIHTPAARAPQPAVKPATAPSSEKAILQAIKELELQRDTAVKGFNDKINALRDSLPSRSSMPSGPSGSTGLYGLGKGSVGAAAYKKLFGNASFRPTAGKTYPITVDGAPYTMEVTHIISNNMQLVSVGPKGSRNRDNTMLAVKGEGIWNENDMNLPAQYRRHL